MEIITDRLRLRELTPADRPALVAILQDAETMVAYEGPFDDAEVDAWLLNQFRRYTHDGFGLWAVELSSTGEVIGQCGITRQQIEGQQLPEVGYLFNRKYWHQGFATEAAAACLDYGFHTLGLPRIYCQVRDTNLASQGVARRLGMSQVASFTKHYRGADMPHVRFTKDCSEPLAP